MSKDIIPPEIKKRLTEINSIIKTLDADIKLAAFELLKPFVLSGLKFESSQTQTDEKMDKNNPKTINVGDVRDFYASFNPKKEADSVMILAAWIYTQRGSGAFKLKELEELFDEVGVSRPNRIDMTLKSTRRKGKNLFTNAGHGSYRPTVYGENHFKTELNLRPRKQGV